MCAQSAFVDLDERRVLGQTERDDLADSLPDPAVIGGQRPRFEWNDEHHARLDRRIRGDDEGHQHGQDAEDHPGSRLTHRSDLFRRLDASGRG